MVFDIEKALKKRYVRVESFTPKKGANIERTILELKEFGKRFEHLSQEAEDKRLIGEYLVGMKGKDIYRVLISNEEEDFDESEFIMLYNDIEYNGQVELLNDPNNVVYHGSYHFDPTKLKMAIVSAAAGLAKAAFKLDSFVMNPVVEDGHLEVFSQGLPEKMQGFVNSREFKNFTEEQKEMLYRGEHPKHRFYKFIEI